MQSATLSSESYLLTEFGWSRIRNRKITVPALGTDRYGSITTQTVSIKPVESSGSLCFVGTEGTFGFFAEGTLLRTHSGEVLTPRSLAERNDPGEVYFEHLLNPPNIVISDVLGGGFFEALSVPAAFVTNDRLAVRCRDSKSRLKRMRAPRGCDLMESNGQLYCVFEREEIIASLAKNWVNTILQIGRLVAHDSKEDNEEFNIDWVGFFLWYISGLHAQAIRHHVEFDSIQYSRLIRIRKSGGMQSPFKKVRCAYYSHLDTEHVRLDWPEPSWSPIVNGFLLSH